MLILMSRPTFKQFEKDAWEAKASRYNDTWGTVTSQAIEPLLNLIKDPFGLRLLDAGCGPGHLCKKAEERGMQVTGVDYSEAMVAIAQKNYPGLEFKWGDAEDLPFAAAAFDIVVLNYLLLHVADQKKTLLEAKRVLKPGGSLIFTNWLPPSESPGLKLIFDALKEFADMSVIPPAQDIFMFSDSGLASKFFQEEAGFESTTSLKYETSWHVSDPEVFYTAAQAGTRMGGLIDLQCSEAKNNIKKKILNDIEKFKTNKAYTVPTPSLIVKATLAA